jgi:hypothetical protein
MIAIGAKLSFGKQGANGRNPLDGTQGEMPADPLKRALRTHSRFLPLKSSRTRELVQKSRILTKRLLPENRRLLRDTITTTARIGGRSVRCS